MTADLHARLVAALDEEQARAEAATPGPWFRAEGFEVRTERGPGWVALGSAHYDISANLDHIAAQDPACTLARVVADRRVLERHAPVGGRCVQCRGLPPSPCPDVVDLAARLDVEVES